ncbi:MAG: sensor domain-containing diguanylate cyclase [Janthinobacterium lividum]
MQDEVLNLAALEAENETLLAFLYLCPAGVVQFAADGTIQLINPQAAQLLNPISRTINNIFVALGSCAPELRNIAEDFPGDRGQILQGHRIVVSQSGPGPRFLSCSLIKINTDCLVAVLQDISHEVQQEQKLKQNETLFSALVTGVNDFALFSLDACGNISTWNASAVRQTGYTVGDMLGHDLKVLVDDDVVQPDLLTEQVVTAAQEGWSLRQARFIRRDGEGYWCQILIAATEDARGGIQGYSVVLRDVTERRMTAEELRRLLTTDHLTGAASRAHFFEQAAVILARSRQIGRPVSVVMLDVDHFKSVNDGFGHAAGDAVLQALVQHCRLHLQRDDMLARLGGEEFVVLLPDTELLEAARIAERMRLTVATIGDLPVNVTISLGCAQMEGSGDGIDALLRLADEALYRAKRAGRDQVMLASPLPEFSGLNN